MEDTIIDFDDKVKKYEYLATKPRWVYKWIIKGHKFPLLNHHKSILLQTIDDLKEINKVKMDFKDEVNIKDINTNDYFINEFNQRKLFDCLINDAKTSDQNLFNNIASLITTITKNNYAMNLFIEIIHLNIKEDNESKESIHSLVNLLLQISNNENFKDYFKQNYYNNLIDIGLSYEFRTDSEFLSKISKLYCKSNHHYSSRITHLVGFMFLLNQQNIIPDALALCSNIEYQKLDNVIHIIEKYLDNELNNINPSYLILKSFLEQIPFLAKQKILKLINRMNALFRKYIKSNDENLINLLCLIFNFITPNRNENDSLVNGIDFSPQTWKTSIENIQKHKKKRKIKINEVPDDYVQKYPDFFKQFRKNVKIINKIINDQETSLSRFKCFQEFPELINFQSKLKYFNKKMKSLINDKQSICLTIDRSNILSSSFNELKKINNKQLLNKINIHFIGEEGIDDGGLKCEWFTLIVKEILNPKNKLFIKSDTNNKYQPNPFSITNPDHIEYFKFAGRIFARVIIECKYVNAHFTNSFLRQLLKHNIRFDDLEDFDEEIYKSLYKLFEIDVDPIDLDFTIDINNENEIKTVLLNENGDEMKVTNENKKEYISLYTNYHLKKSIISQIEAFIEGFYSLIPYSEIGIFNPEELDFIICGSQTIDINDLQENTVYEYPYHSEHPVIKMFFNVISKWDNENLKKFLNFLTGSPQVPINCFSEYKERKKPITVEGGGDKDHLCVAHTCYNVLDLPKYESEQEMNDKLLQSIEECQFGIK